MKKLTSISLDVSKKLIFELADKKASSFTLPISRALGYAVAKDILCKKNLPSFNNSALDGYAFRICDINEPLYIKDTIFAGDNFEVDLNQNECYKIMTGAKIPNNADTIVGFENTLLLDDKHVETDKSITKGNAFRKKGEEARVGEVLFEEGVLINSANIAIFASQGISEIEVYKKPSIAIFSTGNELKEPSEQASDDEIYNVNSSALLALFGEFGFEADNCGVIPDNLEQSKAYFQTMKRYDVLVTTGGISMGEADFVEEALLFNGLKSLFHGVNIKPGRPTMIGEMDDTIVASMPGNPLAAYVNAFVFLIPMLKKLQGVKEFYHKRVVAKMSDDLKIKDGRSNLILGTYEQGRFTVAMENRYGSGMILPILQSNALLITDEQTSQIAKDESVKIILFKGFF